MILANWLSVWTAPRGEVRCSRRISNLEDAGKRQRRRKGFRRSSTMQVEAVERRVLLSADQSLVGTELTGTEFENYAPPADSDEFTEDYAAYNQEYVLESSTDLQAEIVDPGVEYLEAAAYEFAMEAAEYSGEWNETYGVETIDTGYGEPLTVSADPDIGLPDYDGDSAEDGSLFDYQDGNTDDDDSTGYAEYLAGVAVTGYSEPAASTEPAGSSTTETGSGAPAGSAEEGTASTQEETETPSSESSSQQDDGNTEQQDGNTVTEQQSNVTTATETSTTETESVTETIREPIAPPEVLQLSIPVLPTEALLEDLFSVTAPATSSFSNESVTTATPVEEPITGELTGTREIKGSSTVTRTLVYVSASDWMLTDSRSTEWATTDSTVDSEGVSSGVEKTGGSSMTIVVSSTGTTSVTIGEYETITNSTGDSWDNSDPTEDLVDTGWFDGTVTNSRSTTLSTTETLTTVAGAAAVTLTVSGSTSTSSSVSISGGFDQSMKSGTLNSFGQGAVAVYSASGNGEQTTSYAQLAISGGHSTSAGFTITATTQGQRTLSRCAE